MDLASTVAPGIGAPAGLRTTPVRMSVVEPTCALITQIGNAMRPISVRSRTNNQVPIRVCCMPGGLGACWRRLNSTLERGPALRGKGDDTDVADWRGYGTSSVDYRNRSPFVGHEPSCRG